MELTPNDVEAEKHVLSAMMMRTEAVWEVLDVIQPSDFFEPKHEVIARALVMLAQQGKPTDVIALTDMLESAGDLQRAGGVAYLHGLSGYTPTSVNVGYYADIVHEEGRRRAMRAAGDRLRLLAEDKSLDTDQMVDTARKLVDGLSANAKLESVGSSDVAARVIGNIGKANPSIPTPWLALDRQMRGFRKGALYIIGARPGIGKSAIALQCAHAMEHFGNVGFFTLEMSKEEVVARLVAQETGIAHSMIDGENPLPDWAQLRVDMWLATYEGRIQFDDRAGLTLAQIRATIRGWARRGHLSGVVVDYLQLMRGNPRDSRLQQITDISTGLKEIAREYDIPVIALSQLNRNSEHRVDRKPALSDLRESGSIEQDADVVLLLHRDCDDPDSPLEVNVAKNRQGPQGAISLGWEGEFMRAVA